MWCPKSSARKTKHAPFTIKHREGKSPGRVWSGDFSWIGINGQAGRTGAGRAARSETEVRHDKSGGAPAVVRG